MTSESGNLPSTEHVETLKRKPHVSVSHVGNAIPSVYQADDDFDGKRVPRDPLHMIMTALLRDKWPILAVTVILSAVAVPLIWKFVVPVYRARAVVRVSPVGTKIVFTTEDNGIVPLYKSFLNTQVSIIRGPIVLERVLDEAAIQATQWYKHTARPLIGSSPTRLERLLKDLAVAPRPNTELIDVAVTARSAADAKLIADTVVDVYQAYSNELITETDIVRLETLMQEKGDLEREIDGLVATRSHMTAQIGAADPVDRLSQASARLSILEAERDDLNRKLSMARWELSELSTDHEDKLSISETESNKSERRSSLSNEEAELRPADYVRDPEWRRLKEGLAAAQHNLDHGRQRFGPLHPSIAELLGKVTHAQELLEERSAQLDEQARSLPETNERGVVDSAPGLDRNELNKLVERLTKDLAFLDTMIEKVRAKAKELGQITKDMARYEEELRHKRETHDLLRTRVEQLALERKAPARITVAGYSVQPTSPSRDRRPVFTVIAILGSLTLALSLSCVRLVMDPTVRDRGDVSVDFSAQFLGHLPQLTQWASILESCPPPVLEVMRMVRTALLERVDPNRGNALLVTSSASHAGKTSVSILLAKSFASLGKRTLLVEADLRRPSIARRLALDAQWGLASVLTGDAVDQAAICSPPTVSFDILPAGKIPDGFTPDILANGEMMSAVQRWRQQYDFVILDSPPASPVADARILGGLCDGTIMVIRASHCRRVELAEACNSLATTGGNILGTILIGGARSATYPGYYDDYYGDGEKSGEPSLLAQDRLWDRNS